MKTPGVRRPPRTAAIVDHRSSIVDQRSSVVGRRSAAARPGGATADRQIRYQIASTKTGLFGTALSRAPVRLFPQGEH